MAQNDPIRLPLRWEFVPVEEPKDRSVRWRWRAYNQVGELAMSSDKIFENLTDCMADARLRGFADR
jgi:hypothetical protein